MNVIPIETDGDGRMAAIVGLDIPVESLNAMLVREGLAWVYTEYCKLPDCERLKELEQAARAAGHGLWADKEPIPPWEWRKK